MTPEDYERVSHGIIEFGIGDTHQTHTINITDDNDCEPDEYFISSITSDGSSNIVVIQPSAIIWIIEPECGEC